jgi:alpha-galactosidase
MKGLADYVHGLGLKIGLYSSPGPWTCGGCVGSWQHEEQDAALYGLWGFDYLKYDWCSYSSIVSTNRRQRQFDLETSQRP